MMQFSDYMPVETNGTAELTDDSVKICAYKVIIIVTLCMCLQ